MTVRRHRRTTVRMVALAAGAVLVLAGCAGAGDTEPGADAPASSADPADPGDATDPGTETPDPEPADQADGDSPLAFETVNLDGEPVDASVYDGQSVVLWFWAPWCTICRAESGDVADVAAELEGEVVFLGVPGLGEVADMQAFVQETGTGGFEHLVDDDGSLLQRFSVASQPAHAFISPDGEVEVAVGSLSAEQIRERATALGG